MLTRQKSCALDNKSSPNLQSQHVSVTLPNYSVVDTEDWIKSSRCQSQTTVYELPKRYSSGSTNSSTTNGNTVITSNNNNINNNLIASRISSKSKNLISVDPPKSLQSSTFLNDNKVKKGYSNYPYFNVPRQSSQ
ncbi:unnamed protein product [Heterobilharzia americana]|nr:unnamed protein product [Heterobilharzia americana]